MAGHWWKWPLMGVMAVPLLVLGCDRVQMICWVGRTDLQVEFAITDAATGAPVPGARVEICEEKSGLYQERDEKQFVLVCTSDGRASKECRDSMCFGTRSGLRFTDTFVVHLPWWRFRVVADGYEPSEWTELDEPEYIRQARRVSPGKAKLVVPIELHKK
jgi:hypothetical protein